MIKLILQIYRFIQIPTQGFTGEPFWLTRKTLCLPKDH